MRIESGANIASLKSAQIFPSFVISTRNYFMYYLTVPVYLLRA
jgi:hypothetical protein